MKVEWFLAHPAEARHPGVRSPCRIMADNTAERTHSASRYTLPPARSMAKRPFTGSPNPRQRRSPAMRVEANSSMGCGAARDGCTRWKHLQPDNANLMSVSGWSSSLRSAWSAHSAQARPHTDPRPPVASSKQKPLDAVRSLPASTGNRTGNWNGSRRHAGLTFLSGKVVVYHDVLDEGWGLGFDPSNRRSCTASSDPTTGCVIESAAYRPGAFCTPPS